MSEPGAEAPRSGERRRYTRRAPQTTPPYFDAFERIAVALERIAENLGPRGSAPPKNPPEPRRRSRGS